MNNKTFWEVFAELGSKDFKTYAGISRLADNELGYCFATNRSIAEKCNKNFQVVSRDINDLIKKGYLFSIEIKEKSNTIERRLYTCENYMSYVKDNNNLDNLVKTTYKVIEGIVYLENERKKLPIDQKVDTPIYQKVDTPIDQKVDLIISNNNLSNINSKTEEPVPVIEKILSKTEKVKLVLNIEKVQLDFKFIKELVDKYDYQTIVELIKLVPKDAENHGAYLRGIIKNTKPKTNKITKKEVVEVQKVEEPKEKEPRDIIIAKFCIESNCQIENIPTFLKNILNKTLEGLNYEQIS